MIRLAKLTDYAIVLLTRVAQVPPEHPPQAARDLAAATHLPLPTVSKLLKTLSKAGLLSSHRGIHGGYSLTRRPETISVAEIIQALEGPIALTQCSAPLPSASACELEAHCPTRTPWRRISLAVQTALEGLTLADMTQPSTVAPPPSLLAHSAPPALTEAKDLRSDIS